jgi:hypothetical protein
MFCGFCSERRRGRQTQELGDEEMMWMIIDEYSGEKQTALRLLLGRTWWSCYVTDCTRPADTGHRPRYDAMLKKKGRRKRKATKCSVVNSV